VTSAVGAVASILCALLIDRVGRKYFVAFLASTVPLVILTALGAVSATQVVVFASVAYAILQTISFASTSAPPSSTRPGCGPSAPASGAPRCTRTKRVHAVVRRHAGHDEGPPMGDRWAFAINATALLYSYRVGESEP
jgi:MFS family permease